MDQAVVDKYHIVLAGTDISKQIIRSNIIYQVKVIPKAEGVQSGPEGQGKVRRQAGGRCNKGRSVLMVVIQER